jgi:hypothetical protein
MGFPSTRTCFSGRCQPRGRTTSVAISSDRRYPFPSSLTNSIFRTTASVRLTCPPTMFSQVGALASSKSAMNTLAPELSALMIIFRSVGPVISTRRSARSGGGGATFQLSSSRMLRVCSRKSGISPARMRSCRSARLRKSSPRVPSNSRCSPARKPSASSVSTSAARPSTGARTSIPSGMVTTSVR